MELLDFYYYNLGEEPKELERTITDNTFSYLKDNGYTENQIIELIKDLPPTMTLTPSDLPDKLWEGSLVKRDVFYYHSELHITSPAPYWDLENDRIVSSRFFLEMRIKYTVKDLIAYYYKKFPNDISLIDNKKDVGTMEYLLKKYSKVSFIEPIDFILYLIDEAADSGSEVNDMIELKRFENDTFKYLENKTINAAAEKMNRIIWR